MFFSARTGTLKTLAILSSLFLISACQTVGQQATTSNSQSSAPKVAETKPEPKSEPAPKTTEVVAPEKKAAEDLLAGKEIKSENLNTEKTNPSFSLRKPEENAVTPVRIAVLLPLSGQHKKIGTDLLNAANMALFDHQNSTLKLQPYDTLGTPEGARLAAEKAIREGAEVILGPLFSGSVKAVQATARQNNVNVLAFSTDVTAASSGVYLLGHTVEQQVQRILDFAYRQGIVDFAVLAPQNAYGDKAMVAIRTKLGQLGLNLREITRYPTDLPPGSEELHEYAKKIANYDARNWQLRQEVKKVEGKEDPESKALQKRLSKLDTLGDVNFEALIIPDGGQKLRELAPLLSYYDIDPAKVQFIGTGLWADPSLTTEPSLVGGWFAAPPPAATEQFLQRFKSIFGYTPPRIASLAYDAMALAGLLAYEPGDNKFSTANIENREGFSGYNGIFRLKPSGLSDRGLAVMRLGQSDMELLEEAPANFTPALN